MDLTNKKEMRNVYKDTLEVLLSEDDKVFILDADLANCINSGSLYEKFPSQSNNCGISEANMISMAAGLSLTGLKPYAHTFAPFITRRVLDQIYMSIAYSHTNVFLYGSEPGIYSQANGGTHCSIEDLAILRSIPYINIFAASDPTSFTWILKDFASNPKAIYTRAPRAALPYIYDSNESFTFGKAKYLNKGNKVAVITIGDRVHKAIEATNELANENINITLIDLLFVKPYDKELLQEVIKDHDYIITFENHNIYGGIGDLVASEIATSDYSCKLIKLGINDESIVAGDLNYLENKYKISKQHLIDTVKNIY